MANFKRKYSYRPWREVQQLGPTYSDKFRGITQCNGNANVINVAWLTWTHVTKKASMAFGTWLYSKATTCRIRLLRALPIWEADAKSSLNSLRDGTTTLGTNSQWHMRANARKISRRHVFLHHILRLIVHTRLGLTQLSLRITPFGHSLGR